MSDMTLASASPLSSCSFLQRCVVSTVLLQSVNGLRCYLVATGRLVSLPILPSLELTARDFRSGLREQSSIITDFPLILILVKLEVTTNVPLSMDEWRLTFSWMVLVNGATVSSRLLSERFWCFISFAKWFARRRLRLTNRVESVFSTWNITLADQWGGGVLEFYFSTCLGSLNAADDDDIEDACKVDVGQGVS